MPQTYPHAVLHYGIEAEMAAKDNLSPDQFFHGTTHNVKGGVVLPADAADKNVSDFSMGDPGDMSEGDHAFAIRNDENYAWHAANTFHSNGRRPRVYEVDPAPDMKPGPWNKDHPDFLQHHELSDADYPHYPPHPDDVAEAKKNHQDEWASETGFPVRKRIDIMPGRQGTFPSVNWNKHLSERARWGAEANHPDDEQVKYGITGLSPSQETGIQKQRNKDAAAPKEPQKRTGASLRAFMEGKPEPKPEDPQGRLF